MEKMEEKNIYKLNICQVATFMFKIKRDFALAAFRNDFRKISHCYITGFSQNNFVEGNILSNQTKLAVLSRGVRFWNRLLNQEPKNMPFINDCQNSVKTSLLCLEYEIYF